MHLTKLLCRALCAIVGIAGVALLMASECEIDGPIIIAPVVPVVPPPSPPPPSTIDIHLVNDSGEFVHPVLYADDEFVDDLDDIIDGENLIDIGPPLAPGEVATVTLACEDALSVLSDADIVEFADGTTIESTLLLQDQQFFCGEEITMYYEPIPLPVTVEFVNSTSNFVESFFWSDPGTVFNPDFVSIPENFVDLGPPLEPGEVVTVTLDCIDAGTFLVDGDLLLVPAGRLPSQNLLLLNEGDHFLCGDLVSFYYEVDGFGGFFISADVNDVTIAP